MSYLPDLLTSLANVAGQVQTAINVAIAKLPDGTTTSLSTTGPTAGAISVIGSASIPALPSALTSADLFDVQRAGNTFTATVAQVAAGLGAGSTATAFEGLDQQPAAAAFSDTDALPIAQPSQVGGSLGTLVRGTAAQIWAYTASKMPSYRIPVVELTANTTLDGPAHNRRILVCTTSLTLAVPATFGNLTPAGVAFETELQIESGATLTLPTTGAAITGPATIVGPAQARVRAWITSGSVNRLSCSVPTGGAVSTGTGTTPAVTITGVAPLAETGTSTATFSFTGGTPAAPTAAIDATAITVAGFAATVASGTGSTAAGTGSFTFTCPAAGAHSLVMSSTGTYAVTSASFAFTATAAVNLNGATANFPATLHLFFGQPSTVTINSTYGVNAFLENGGTRGFIVDNNNSGPELTPQRFQIGVSRSATSAPTNLVTGSSDPGGDGSFLANCTRGGNGLWSGSGGIYPGAHPGTYYLWAVLTLTDNTVHRCVWSQPITVG